MAHVPVSRAVEMGSAKHCTTEFVVDNDLDGVPFSTALTQYTVFVHCVHAGEEA